MADQNDTAATATPADQGTTSPNTDQAAEAAPAKFYPTRTEAEANKPADATKNHKVFEVAKAGAAVGYLWARGYDNALALTARLDGYSASLGSNTPVTKEAVAAKLAEFTDDELAAMGLARKPQKGGKK
jgi:hypothetical protein